MPPQTRDSFAALLRRPSGLIVIAGPRRSGRTTTARAAADEMDDGARRTVVVERSPARPLATVSQIAAAVGGHDVDGVVLDGLDGAPVVRTAVRLAQRGALVVMTLTAGDPDAIIPMLLDVGVPRATLAVALHAVLAQERRPGRRPRFELVADA